MASGADSRPLADSTHVPLSSFHRSLMLTITSPATCLSTPELDRLCAKSVAKASARPALSADTKLSTPRYVAPRSGPIGVHPPP